ncbi:hypothetical protein HAX54_047397 [Datura stramonium]|uniref:Uncharacterized protein n=1 Tax=Datura stramonium TaxID=4076 RepID=A0ABS8SSD2_DATST|nr:hypothetical protein [Datura stramonium]
MVRCGWFGKRQGLVVSSGSVMLWWLDERGAVERGAVACSEDEMKEVNDAGEVGVVACGGKEGFEYCFGDVRFLHWSDTVDAVDVKRRGKRRRAGSGGCSRWWWFDGEGSEGVNEEEEKSRWGRVWWLVESPVALLVLFGRRYYAGALPMERMKAMRRGEEESV